METNFLIAALTVNVILVIDWLLAPVFTNGKLFKLIVE